MPIESSFEHGQKLIVSRATGRVGLEDLRDYFGRVWTAPKHRGYSEIFDWTGADAADFSTGELRSLAGAAHAFYDESTSSRLAIVVEGEEGTRLAGLYRTLREMRGDTGLEIRIFEDTASARAWITSAR